MEERYRGRKERERERERKRKARRKHKAIFMTMEIVALVATVFLVYKVGTGVYQFAKGEMTKTEEQSSTVGTGEIIDIEIPEGASTKDIAKALKDAGLIDNEFMFRMKSRFDGFDGTYKHGEYSIAKGTEDSAIMALLQEGNVNAGKIKITIPEGFTQQQIGNLLEQQGIMTADVFMQEANTGVFEYPFLDGLKDRPSRLEGYLFPDTYFLKEGATANDIICKMLDRFQQVYTEALDGRLEDSEYSLDEMITIASIVESEIQLSEERPIAAGVIYNRLEEEMPLQMDSTVLYAMGIKKEKVTYKDLEVDSPYNTYQNTGLPEGPICNPGQAAIEAAVSPAEHKYLYYVLKERGSGEHVYQETYEAFLKDKEQYKKSLEGTEG